MDTPNKQTQANSTTQRIQLAPKILDVDSLQYLLENNSKQKIMDEFNRISPGVKTGYKIAEIDLAFPGGEISVIAAPTSHGKTTALINFCLGAVKENPEMTMYFFSYEESGAPILASFMNTHISTELSLHGISQPLSNNNKRSIESYFRSGTLEYIESNLRDMFLVHEKSFFENIIDAGKIRVFYSEMTVDELIKAINYIHENGNPGIIFIDYIQLLKLSDNNKSTRQEELKKICLLLKDCAVKTGLPIVLTAQFNRSVVAEEELFSLSIGEAGDIERIAALIIGMYNRSFVLKKEGNIGKDGKKVEKQSTIYFEVLKGRKVGAGHSCIMNFDGNRGMITNQMGQQREPINRGL